MTINRRSEALEFSERLLTDFEESNISPVDILRRASRLARLLDDTDALEWLSIEIAGYESYERDGGLNAKGWAAAVRSGRKYRNQEGHDVVATESLSGLQSKIVASKLQLAASADAPSSVTSANPNQFVSASYGNKVERDRLNGSITRNQATLDKVLGAIFQYVSAKHVELRFGSAVESAFDRVRTFTEAELSDLVPDALQKLTAAFELSTSDNPEHWADAAAYCRKLIIAVADTLQPAGVPINGRKNGAENYVNRLVYWVEQRLTSNTTGKAIVSDLEDFGKRLDAFAGAGNKGAHARVEQSDADRFIIGTYMLISDVLRLRSGETPSASESDEPQADTKSAASSTLAQK
ncbi:AbiTii domain-containing protein [Rhodococcus qingshengii]|uniref:AbiTii domain-containing protein n=1 Tax=Rhodococcus qingshengii TaxID=334542 RepID=UPI0035FA6973